MQTEPWSKALAYNLDQPLASYGFSLRLAAENFWTRNFTQKAILEYKKFMYLAATSDVMVSPSPIIDKVWHEHIMFSKSYKEFCDLLGKEIQHVPSTRNAADSEKFKLAKERTIILYNNTFGELPGGIWNYASMYDSLNLPKARIKIRTFVIITILLFILLIAPTFFLLKPLYIRIDNPDFIIGFVALIVTSLILLEIWNQKRMGAILQQAHSKSFIFDLHPFEVVYLQTQKLFKAINGPLNNMVVTKKITIDRENKMYMTKDAKADNLEEYEIMLAFAKCRGSSFYPALLALVSQVPVFANISNSMDALKKYIQKSKSFGTVFYVNFIVLGILMLAGVTRLVTGVTRDKPVQIIFFVLIALGICIGLYLHRVSRMVCITSIPTRYKKDIIPQHAEAQDWSWQYALLGATVLSPMFSPLDSYVEKHNSSGSGSSCGSSCASSCGSSCGGCGGD